MLKRIVTSCLLLIVFFATVGLLLMIWIQKSELNSLPNQLWQASFWYFPYTERTILGTPALKRALYFWEAGDDKYDYLSNDFFDKILVQIDTDVSLNLPPDLEKDIKEIIKNAGIKKEVEIQFKNPVEIESEWEDFSQFNKLRSSFDGLKTRTKTLHIIFIPQSKMNKKNQDYGGIAYLASSILIGINEKLNPELSRLSLRSKFAHEFGHLLGLKHIPDSKCVMYKHSYAFDFTEEGDYQRNQYIGHMLENAKEKYPELYEETADTFFPYKYKCKLELKRLKEVRSPTLIRKEKYPGSYYYTQEMP